VAEQVERKEKRGGTEALKLRQTNLPIIIVTHRGWKTGAIRKTPLMRVVDRKNYILVASNGGAADNPLWVNNLRTDP
jgi:deazaflavin-dependent oxidoreductase (nitroreductase family)